LPECPFLGLLSYSEEYSPLFLGRGREIRALYDKIKGNIPIILYFGRSGVGKSSLLKAGILPRLEQDYHIIYVRRNPELGLLKTFEQALHNYFNTEKNDTNLNLNEREKEEIQIEIEKLEQLEQTSVLKKIIQDLQEKLTLLNSEKNSSLDFWKQIESSDKDQPKPLIFILDQIEEAFTKPIKDLTPKEEIIQFFNKIKSFFKSFTERPAGKIILSFRSERKAEIEKLIRSDEIQLPYEELFLSPLSEEGVKEVITGLTKDSRLAEKYNINVEPNFEADISNILLRENRIDNKTSPVAPVLQILLKKMWERCSEISEREKLFGYALFKEIGGITWLDDFLQEKLNTLNEDSYAKGLVLGILFRFTTNTNSTNFINLNDIKKIYHHQEELVSGLFASLEKHKLIIKTGTEGQIFRLIHDSLAISIRSKYNKSNYSGQVALRILENLHGEYLRREELKIIEIGIPEIRALTDKEKNILIKSRKIHIGKTIKGFISVDKLEEAIEYLKFYNTNVEEVANFDNIILVQARYNYFEENKYNYYVSEIDKGKEKKRIIDAILFLVTEIKKREIQKLNSDLINFLNQGNLDYVISELLSYYEMEDESKFDSISRISNQMEELKQKELYNIISVEDSIIKHSRIFLDLTELLRLEPKINEKKERITDKHLTIERIKMSLLEGDWNNGISDLWEISDWLELEFQRKIISKHFKSKQTIQAYNKGIITEDEFYNSEHIYEDWLRFYRYFCDEILLLNHQINLNVKRLKKRTINGHEFISNISAIALSLKYINTNCQVLLNNTESGNSTYILLELDHLETVLYSSLNEMDVDNNPLPKIQEKSHFLNQPMKLLAKSKKGQIHRDVLRNKLIYFVEKQNAITQNTLKLQSLKEVIVKAIRFIIIDRTDLALIELLNILQNDLSELYFKIAYFSASYHSIQQNICLGITSQWRERENLNELKKGIIVSLKESGVDLAKLKLFPLELLKYSLDEKYLSNVATLHSDKDVNELKENNTYSAYNELEICSLVSTVNLFVKEDISDKLSHEEKKIIVNKLFHTFSSSSNLENIANYLNELDFDSLTITEIKDMLKNFILEGKIELLMFCMLRYCNELNLEIDNLILAASHFIQRQKLKFLFDKSDFEEDGAILTEVIEAIEQIN